MSLWHQAFASTATCCGECLDTCQGVTAKLQGDTETWNQQICNIKREKTFSSETDGTQTVAFPWCKAGPLRASPQNSSLPVWLVAMNTINPLAVGILILRIQGLLKEPTPLPAPAPTHISVHLWMETRHWHQVSSSVALYLICHWSWSSINSTRPTSQ